MKKGCLVINNKFKIVIAGLIIFIFIMDLIFNVINKNIFQIVMDILLIILGIKFIYSISDNLYVHFNKLKSYIINKRILFITKYKIISDATTTDSIISQLNPILRKNSWYSKQLNRSKFSNTINYDVLISGVPVKLKVILSYHKNNKMCLQFKMYCPVKYRKIKLCLNMFDVLQKSLCNQFNDKKGFNHVMYIASNSRVFNPYIRIKLNNLGSYYMSFKYNNVKVRSDLHKIHFASSNKTQVNKMFKDTIKPF